MADIRGVCKLWNGLLEWWNSGMENFSQMLHPNKAHIPISQHINTLHVLNERKEELALMAHPSTTL